MLTNKESQGAKQSTDLQVFNSPEFGEIRTTLSASNEPLFCLADLCRVVQIKNHRNVKKRLDLDDVHVMDTIDSMKRIQSLIYVTESGMYDVIMRSDSNNVRPFRKWVCSEVLPAIRKQGGYITTNANDDEQTILAKAILIANSTIEKIKADNKRLSQQIEDDAPKVLFANAVTTSDKSILVGELAKILKQNGIDMGQNRLFQWLRDNNYLCKRGESFNQPTQFAMERGLFEIKKITIQKPNGKTMVNTVSKVSPKGQIYFIDKFLRNVKDVVIESTLF